MQRPHVCLLFLLSIGCASSAPGAADSAPPDAEALPDAPSSADASTDRADEPDAAADLAVDVAIDLSPDVVADLTPDAPIDVAADLAADAPADAETDVPPFWPTPLPNGAQCAADLFCRSGWCIDGVCCDTSCTGLCRSCRLPGKVGTCLAIAEGTDPDNECSQSPRATCQRDGFCDGQGSCRLYTAGTECAPATCTGSTEFSSRICDGSGACQPAASRVCVQGCSGGVCAAPCNASNPCLAGTYCDTFQACRPTKAQGVACTTADECTSGYCVDGVCCGSACTGTCQSCNLPGALGLCSPVPSSQDPQNECPADANAACGRIGGCDGAGACTLQPSGTPCNAGASTCDGRGMCTR